MSPGYAAEIAKSFVPEAFKGVVRDVRESLHRIVSPTFYRNTVSSSARIGQAVLGGNVFVGEQTSMTGDVRVGKFTTFNSGCLILGGRIRIGNYTQFGPKVAVYTVNHTIDLVSIYNSRGLFNGMLKDLAQQHEVTIGNDVWLGHGALIMPGVHLGTGCVVAAGAVVTKSVPPYAIVGGCPARLMRFRIAEPLASLILESHWWCLDPPELAAFRDVFTQIPQKVPHSRLEELSKLGRARAESLKDAEGA
jgi:acetyltransferase-like isoleucine patch superfamily enzyme